MKKLVYFALLLSIILGCGRKNVYHTYFGDVNIDTVTETIIDFDSTMYYLVDIQTHLCSIAYPTETVYWKDTTWHYYNPDKDAYCYTFKDKYGNHVILEYDPYQEQFNW